MNTQTQFRKFKLIESEEIRNDVANVTTEVIDLTPELATEMLAKNEGNRRIRQGLVNALAADIVNGRWAFNGDTIKVTSEGELNDGQHRCLAVIQAGKSIKTLVVKGVSRGSRFKTDMGAARTAGTFLEMAGVTSPNVIARVAALLLQHETSGVPNRPGGGWIGSMTKQKVIEFAYENMEELRAAVDVINDNACRKLASSANIAFATLLLTRAGGIDKSHEFIEALQSGANLDVDSPIYLARERLIKEKFEKTTTPRRVLEIIIRAWNSWVAGLRGKRIAVYGTIPKVSQLDG